MKLFIDTADVDQISEINTWGIVSGVTTNPSLIAKEGKDIKEVIEKISKIIDGPVSAEVISLYSEEMIKEARELASINSNIVVKIPMTEEGLKAVNILSDEGIPTNVTLVFSPQQALLAARAGAKFVSPFIGRLDDIGVNGIELLEEIVNVFYTHGIETEIIAASIRGSKHVLESAKVGADIATIPYGVFKEMVKHPLTDLGLDKFIRDWEDSQSN